MWWLEVAKATTFASINPISFKSTRSDRICWMKLWLKHLLVPYMPPYQGDLAELTGSFRPFMTFVAFIWPFSQTFLRSKFLFEYILEDWPITCGFKASQIAICKIVKPFSICGGYALRQPFVDLMESINAYRFNFLCFYRNSLRIYIKFITEYV